MKKNPQLRKMIKKTSQKTISDLEGAFEKKWQEKKKQ